MSDNNLLEVRELPLTIKFSLGRVDTSQKIQKQASDRVFYPFGKVANQNGELFLGSHLLGVAKVGGDAQSFSLFSREKIVDSASLASLSFSLVVTMPDIWFESASGEVAVDSLLCFDSQIDNVKGYLKFAGSDSILAAGEVVLVDGFYGLRITELNPEATNGIGSSSYSRGEVVIGQLELAVEDLESAGVGTIFKLDSLPGEFFDLNVDGVRIAKGQIIARQMARSSYKQTYSVSLSSGEPMLFFQVKDSLSSKKEEKLSSEVGDSSLEERSYNLSKIFSFLNDETLFKIFSRFPLSIGKLFMFFVGGIDSSRGASLLFNYWAKNDEGIVDFISDFGKMKIFPSLNFMTEAFTSAMVLELGEKQRDSCVGDDCCFVDSNLDEVVLKVNIVQNLPVPMQKNFIEILSSVAQEQGEEIASYLFFLDDIVLLSDVDVQKLLRELDSKLVVKVLSQATDEVKDKILSNMSHNAALIIQEDLEVLAELDDESYYESVSLFLNVLRRLEDSGEIVIKK
ncbi:MAG: FliM/FliN family flagellar motor switch protein [Spirochaetales bacterium]|nr:FliM/FliN family flagellar motor switch protein [Spirochaetales bacterium]